MNIIKSVISRFSRSYGKIMDKNFNHIMKYNCLGVVAGSYCGYKQFQKNVSKQSNTFDRSIYLSASVLCYGAAGFPIGMFVGAILPIWAPVLAVSFCYNSLQKEQF
jgi:hypothetical protein